MTPSTLEVLQELAKTSGLVYFVAMFVGVLAYVLRPKNRKTFEAAARVPLAGDE